MRDVIAKARPSNRRVAQVRRGYAAIHALAQLLEPHGSTAAEVRADVKQWQEALPLSLRNTPRERAWQEHFERLLASFGDRLLTCYDHPLLPRTNNDLEQALRALSREQRRITGRKHVGRRLVRTPGLVGAGGLLVREVAAVEHIAHLPRTERCGFRTRRDPRTAARGQALAFRRDPAKFLATLEEL